LVWIAECWNILSQAVTQRTIVDFPAILDHGLAKKIGVRAHANGDPNKQEDGFIFE
jgi:hypothetical protein